MLQFHACPWLYRATKKSVNLPQSESMRFVIRDFVASDYDAIMEIWTLTGMGSPARGDDAEAIQRTIDHGGRLRVMIDTDVQMLIGTSWLTVDGRRTYIHHFGIHPDYQGKGLSKDLGKDSLIIAKQLGYQVKLEVHKDNVIALRLYEMSGFKYLGDYLVYIIRDLESIKL